MSCCNNDRDFIGEDYFIENRNGRHCCQNECRCGCDGNGEIEFLRFDGCCRRRRRRCCGICSLFGFDRGFDGYYRNRRNRCCF
ncbi:MAG: hypothetical protein FWF92_06785 [Oscillospiraceae bacterium]|nr:hypothetical protein [Oscillospiraceae bacterium]